MTCLPDILIINKAGKEANLTNIGGLLDEKITGWKLKTKFVNDASASFPRIKSEALDIAAHTPAMLSEICQLYHFVRGVLNSSVNYVLIWLQNSKIITWRTQVIYIWTLTSSF
jgi:hypothetical protein